MENSINDVKRLSDSAQGKLDARCEIRDTETGDRLPFMTTDDEYGNAFNLELEMMAEEGIAVKKLINNKYYCLFL